MVGRERGARGGGGRRGTGVRGEHAEAFAALNIPDAHLKTGEKRQRTKQGIDNHRADTMKGQQKAALCQLRLSTQRACVC